MYSVSKKKKIEVFWIKESTLLSNLWKSTEPHTTIKKKKEREHWDQECDHSVT